MHDRRIPEWLRHAPAPSVRGFAVLAGTEAVARGILISVFPIAVYGALQDARLVSEIYFAVGLISLLVGLLVPYLTRFIPRRIVYIAGTLMFAGGSLVTTNFMICPVVSGLAGSSEPPAPSLNVPSALKPLNGSSGPKLRRYSAVPFG